jgi:hypothetical protein
MTKEPSNDPRFVRDFKGRRVLIKGGHPHSGRVGSIERVERAFPGWMFVVDIGGGETAGVFNRWEIEFI